MGVVYAAEQTAPIRRRVAVKVIRAGYAATDVIKRFENERQALAVMEHPSIARVYDAGATEQGLPFVVMEYVEGVPIGEYCDAHRLTTRERLALFLGVCHAVQHAHQKGVIHRDLKPSNVLVSAHEGSAVPKVIDFGVAKAVNRRLTNETLVTEVGLVIGTPAYMSPEQAEGAGVDVDTRSDVYALGVMLYELLTGSLPADPSILGLVPFIARLVAGVTVSEAPSSRVGERTTRGTVAHLRGTEPTALARELRGDLDAIVLKAMAPERERRYQTAQELAQDIERHLAHEAIAARPPSVTYRAGKFVRRHPTATALAAAMVLFLIGLSTTMTVQAGRIARARAVAEQRRTQAEDLISYMVGELRGKLEPIGRLELLDDVGKRAEAYFAAVPSTELSDEELFHRSKALGQLGQVRMAQGDLNKALVPFLESRVLASDLAARDPDNMEWLVGLGASHFWIGYTHYLRGALDSALAEFQPYLEISQRLVQRDSTNRDWQLELGYAHSNIGSVQESKGDLASALESFRFTLGVKERLVVLDSSNMDWLRDLGHTENTVGRAQEQLGMLDSAEVHYRADLAISERLARRDTSNMTWRQYLATALTYMSRIHELRGRDSLAAAGYDSALRVARSLVKRDPTNSDWARTTAVNAARAGRVMAQLGRRDAGLALLHEATRSLRLLRAGDSTNADIRMQLSIAEADLARALAERGDVQAAIASATTAERLLAPLTVNPNAEHRYALELSRTHLLLAELHARNGSSDAARQAFEALRLLGPGRAGDELRTLDARARALAGVGQAAEARSLVAQLEQSGYREQAFVRFAAGLTPGSTP
jgi:tetratricopeptide (TPR) repeat protein